MDIALECIPCTIQSYLKLVNSGFIPEPHQDAIMRQILRYLSELDYNQSPPAMAQIMHRQMRSILGNVDPYAGVKKQYNHMMLERYDEFRKTIDRSSNPFNTAMRYAIAGNVIDFGAKHLLDVNETIRRVLHADLAINDSNRLENELKQAETVLYIGDNAGEIVMDRLFIETIGHPNLTYVVRGNPVINDATLDDAKIVGMDEVAQIITTGDDAPGVVWSGASDAFKNQFEAADVVISKGQGNLEGLFDTSRSVYFLFVAKCERMARLVHVSEKSFVVWRKAASSNLG